VEELVNDCWPDPVDVADPVFDEDTEGEGLDESLEELVRDC
jgi:hypothetical protein